jgi:hypothetical protein
MEHSNEKTGVERNGVDNTGLEKIGVEKDGFEKTAAERTGAGDPEPEGRRKVERKLSEALEKGEMSGRDPQLSATDLLTPKYEIRVRAERDTILEETKLYRQMAREVDDRYDKYVERSNGAGESE